MNVFTVCSHLVVWLFQFQLSVPAHVQRYDHTKRSLRKSLLLKVNEFVLFPSTAKTWGVWETNRTINRRNRRDTSRNRGENHLKRLLIVKKTDCCSKTKRTRARREARGRKTQGSSWFPDMRVTQNSTFQASKARKREMTLCIKRQVTWGSRAQTAGRRQAGSK